METHTKSNPLLRVLRSVLTLVKVVVAISVIGVAFVLGWTGCYLTSRIYHSYQGMCYVENAVVVACQRSEDGDFYVWKVAAIRNEGAIGEEIIVIQHRVAKIGFMYAF